MLPIITIIFVVSFSVSIENSLRNAALSMPMRGGEYGTDTAGLEEPAAVQAGGFRTPGASCRWPSAELTDACLMWPVARPRPRGAPPTLSRSDGGAP